MDRIPVVMCVDVEPEERLISSVPQESWPGFETSVKFFTDQRRRLQAVTGSPVHYSWFFRMDPQIAQVYGTAGWVAKRYFSIIQELKQAGDALGLHVHPWRWDRNLSQWIADFGDQEWVEQCVRIGFESFYEELGERCQYFRFGDHWMNNATLDVIDRLGAKYDLTIEPGQKRGHVSEAFTGSFVNYSYVPQYPYRPSRSDFTKVGSLLRRRLWMIPLSAGEVSGIEDNSQDYITLNLYFDSSILSQIIDRLLSGSEKPYLALVLRSDVFTCPEWYSNLRQTLDYVLNHRSSRELVFQTPAEMIMGRK